MGVPMNLRLARKAAQLTQAQLAERAGIEQATVSDLEAGKIRKPSYETVVRLARALNVSAEELFPLHEASQS